RIGLAYESQIENPLDVRIRIDLGARELARADQVRILAGKPDRIAAARVDCRDDLLVDGAREHHLDDLDGGAVGDAEPVDEIALDPEPLQHLADLRPAAVNAERVDADLLQP